MGGEGTPQQGGAAANPPIGVLVLTFNKCRVQSTYGKRNTTQTRRTMNTELIAENLATEEISSSGNQCNFIDLGDGNGIKCFMNQEARDIAYTVQGYFDSRGMAPHVGNSFEIVDYNGDHWYCYTTEVAETLVGYGVENSHAFTDSLYYADDYEYVLGNDGSKENSLMERDSRDKYIYDCYNLTGYEYRDDHVGNWGWILRGDKKKLVAIDFDTCWLIYDAIKSGKII